ncbi:hypothetical protein SASPL_136631 [Salvia splendens]|uniref:RING-CH-type domain-containing protein n=1 Tax=Salvia splendens TaxID=180675 RepID=A0A8X8WYJ8_SALSN|nr:uncharacterized protein LOC121761387 [Salvia splendens]KAG6404385.1 hypothetical protein SASPL_136631 [Salvia splendens]
MSSLQQSGDVDLESANTTHVCGGGGCPAVVSAERGGDAPPSSNGNEIIVNVNEKNERRDSNVSEYSVEMVDLESGAEESKLHRTRIIKDCRICHLSMDATNQESGIPIELGCSCKDDLAASHKQCAEAWFKIKGNKICEICGSIAQNVVGVNEADLIMEQWNEANDAEAAAATAPTRAPLLESRNFWQGHRFLNFLLACMVFAFVISWLFHFNVPS